MADTTAIAWARSTFNPWIGCTKVGPGCDHCYAESMDSRKRWGGVTHWGAGVPRQRTSESNWKQPLAWNRKAAKTGEFWPVFCASLADVFDHEVSRDWRVDLWNLIDATPHLTWLLLTKRIGNYRPVVSGWTPPPNAWIGMTAVTQEELERDLPKLAKVPTAVRWLSLEPQISTIDLTPAAGIVQWAITGGESGRYARRYDVAWPRKIVADCRRLGIAPFVKQLGAFTTFSGVSNPDACWPVHTHWEDMGGLWRVRLLDPAGANPEEWPEDLRVREFPQTFDHISSSQSIET
jgi:protein gp37